MTKTSKEAGLYQNNVSCTIPIKVRPGDYTGSGYDRGHMAPSADRTRTEADNSATFLMSNITPQAPENNQGPWADLEDYSRDLVRQGKELYIIAGGTGSKGTIGKSQKIMVWVYQTCLNFPKSELWLRLTDKSTHADIRANL